MSDESPNSVYVGPGATVLLVNGDAARESEAIASVVRLPDPFSGLIDVLMGIARTGGFAALPTVAGVVQGEGRLRILLRGAVAAEVVSLGGSVVLDGSGVTTWVEQSFAAVTRVRLTATGLGVDVSLAGASLPVEPTPVGIRSVAMPAAISETPASVPALPVEGTHGAVHTDEVAAAFDDGFSDTGYDFNHLLTDSDALDLEAAAARTDEPDEVSELIPSSLIDHVPNGWISSQPDDAIPSFTDMAALQLSEALPLMAEEGADDLNQTLVSEELQKLLADLGKDGRADLAEPDQLPSVQAVRCPQDHPNAPHAEVCRICSQVIVSQKIASIRRPTLGSLVFSHGPVIELDRPLLIGRRPTRSGRSSSSDEAPGLVAVPDPDRCLSRTHAEIRLDGWQVLVVDRGSTNHTFIEAPGQPTMQLRENDQVSIFPGTKVLLGGVASFTFEVSS